MFTFNRKARHCKVKSKAAQEKVFSFARIVLFGANLKLPN